MAHSAGAPARIPRALARPLVAVMAAVALLVALAAAPAAAAPSATMDLSAADFWPGNATTSTVVTFQVTYAHSGGLAPSFVRVHAGGVTKEMQVAAGSNWKQGVVFEATTKLPAGTHTPWFESERGDLYAKLTMGRSISVEGPAPTPKPTPTPTPKPTPTPTPKPTAAPTATPRPTSQPTPTPKPTPNPTATPRPTPRPTATPKQTPKPTPKATPRPASTDKPASTAKSSGTDKPSGGKASPRPTDEPAAAAPAASPEATPTAEPVAAVVIPGGGAPGGSDGTGGAGGSDGRGGTGPVNDGDPALAGSLGGPSPIESFLPILMVVLASAGGVAMLMALLVFGKRRRTAEAPADESLAASAATGYAYVPAPRPVPAPAPVPAPVSPAAAAAAAAAVQATVDAAPEPDLDGHLPRWRRPSLMEARKADPMRGGMAASARLTFDGRAGDAVTGLERRRIRYRLVALLDLPDEVKGVEIGSLDEGDEVVLMEKRGTYWRVLCPDGREGWLHKMTLGDVVIEASTTADSWTSADDGPAPGTFEDILRAYSESRRQFGEAPGG